MTILDEAYKKELVSINVAADLAGVSRRTIYNWMQRNKIRYIRNAGGNIRIIKESLFTENGGKWWTTGKTQAV